MAFITQASPRPATGSLPIAFRIGKALKALFQSRSRASFDELPPHIRRDLINDPPLTSSFDVADRLAIRANGGTGLWR